MARIERWRPGLRGWFGEELQLLDLSQNCWLVLIRYKWRMIRLTDEQWERIRNHFPEEHIADGRPGRKPIPTRRVLEAVLCR